MKKTIALVVFSLVVGIGSGFAQFNKGDKEVRVGLGLLGIGVGVSAEYAIMDDLGVGLYAAYERNSIGYLISNYSYNSLYFGPRATYHFNRLLKLDTDKFDLYASAGILLRNYSYPDAYRSAVLGTKTSYTDVVGLFRVGAKYKFSETLNLFADTGSGGSAIQAGVALKF